MTGSSTSSSKAKPKRKWKRLSEYEKLRAEEAYIRGTSAPELAEQFNVTPPAMYELARRRKWKQKRERFQSTQENALIVAQQKLNDAIVKLRDAKTDSEEEKQTKRIDRMIRYMDRLERRSDLKANAVNLMHSFTDFLGTDCQDTDFKEKFADYLERWFEWIGNQ